MKTISIKHFFVLLIAITFCGTAVSQQRLTAEQWQEDLRFLQETVDSDFPFLFKKVKKEVWDAEVEELYAEIPDLEEHEIEVGLAHMVSLFEYGHTQIPFGTIAKDGVLPVNLYYFKDGIYVEGTQKQHQKILGAKVLKVGDFTVEEALQMIRPVVPVENDSYFKAYGIRFLTVPTVLHAQKVINAYSKNITLTLEKDGKVSEYELTAIPYEELSRNYGFTTPDESWVSARAEGEDPLYLKHLNEKYYYFEYLPESKTVYVRQSSVFNHETEALAEFYGRLFEFIDTNEVQKLIYDVRLNGGGNNYNNKPLIQGIMARPKINAKGKFIYIIGRNTFSACQNLTNEIENYTNAIMIGEPTAENKNFYGDAKKTTLPNSKIDAYLSFAWWQDKPQWENADATTPQILREMTFEEYRTNQDPVLDLAMNYDFDSFLVNPMDHFTKLFIAGEMEQLKTDATRIVKDPVYAHIPFDKEFKQVGRNMLFQEQFEGAVFLYGMFTEYYPEDYEMWEGLGTAFKALGKTAEADEAFAKASSLRDKD
ncbi:tetratricopeptide repeat protein [Maribacter halichondriae]|uniref:tetratricopeptide repeat protein n=1 Tax=Maribacter halichondriae TaxID=2980554 RepID=UPI002359C27A|nr:hypothetical protein [Maribacter sp. Hal144]